MRVRHSRRWATCLVVTVAAGIPTGCGGTAQPGGEPVPRAAAATEAGPDAAAEEAAGKAALAAYSGYLTASGTASRRGDPRHPELARYAADPLLTRVRLAIREAKEHGAMRTGKLVSDPTVTSVDLASTPPTVEIQDCLDATGWRLVYAKDHRPVPGARGGRWLATATAARYPDGRWLISTSASHQDQPC
ncbi:hypothetical protein [Micromonospora mirobrigensis]|uniref:Secreted protein/lipoprotein n=1 Tax=Micromonospora mirobrigensis TaxID=262898 RepID=A0A1C4VK28_9ACTN|nr:hypothetical protein [Micromonospora mirobrigensis]SCE84357.1 hypothetical protein GA0070564_1011267 [Micromonospora mirobrigensis]